jgi:Ca2+/Na+ antiporter
MEALIAFMFLYLWTAPLFSVSVHADRTIRVYSLILLAVFYALYTIRHGKWKKEIQKIHADTKDNLDRLQ